MARRIFFQLCLLLLGFSLLHSEYPKVGKKAPPIDLVDWITGKIEGKKPFAKKTVILDFWATWCGPCVATIPHLNQLSEKFSNSNVVFVSITDEERSIVERFLKDRQMKSSVVIDRERRTNLAYGITGIPHTFLIDAKGILRWHGYPTELTARFLDSFLKTGVAPESVEPPKPVTLTENILRGKLDSSNVFFFSIATGDTRKTSDGWFSSSSSKDVSDFQFHLKSVADMVSTILSVPKARIRTSESVQLHRYDVRLRLNTSVAGNPTKREAIDMICRVAGLQLNEVVDSIKVWMMNVEDPGRLRKSASTGGWHTGGADSIWTATGIPLNLFATSLQDLYGIAVVYQDTISYRCDFDLPADDFEKGRKLLQEKYGVVLRLGMQQAKVVEIAPFATKR